MMRATNGWALAPIVLLSLSLASCSSSKRNDLKPPRVMMTSPGPDAAGVELNADVRVVFDVKIRASSIHGGAFNLRDIETGTLVDATLSYESDSKTAVLRPKNVLIAGHRYEAVLEKSVKSDRYGIELRDGRLAWRFATGAASAPARMDLEFGVLMMVFDEEAVVALGPDYVDEAAADAIYQVALAVGREFVAVEEGVANPDFVAALARAMLRGAWFDELREAGDCDSWLPVNWAEVPVPWQVTLHGRALFNEG